MTSDSTSAYVKLGEAARLTAVHPSTIDRHAKSGKLSCTRDENGQRIFDRAELARVYGMLQADLELPSADTSGQANEKSESHTIAMQAQKIEHLEKEISSLKQQLAIAESRIRDSQSERDEWRTQANQITRLLSSNQKSKKLPSFLEEIFTRK